MLNDPVKERKPSALPVKFENIPESLKAERRWLCWDYQWLEERGQWSKVPINARTGFKAASTKPKTWATFAQACEAYETEGYSGIGFALGDGWSGWDIDKCYRAMLEAFNPDARAILQGVPDAYAEISPSNNGVKLFFKGAVPDGRRTAKTPNGTRIEIYSEGRFFTVTGHHVADSARNVDDVDVTDAYKEWFDARAVVRPVDDDRLAIEGPDQSPIPGWSLERVREFILPHLEGNEYADWTEVGMVMNHQSQIDEDDAPWLEAWDEWSQQFDGYSDEACADKWRTYSQERNTGRGVVRLATLIKKVRVKVVGSEDAFTALDDYIIAFQSAEDRKTAQVDLPKRIRDDIKLDQIMRDELAKHMADALQRITDVRPKADVVKKLLTPAKPEVNPEKALEGRYPNSEFGNMKRVGDKYGKSLMFTPDDGAWFMWDKHYWQRTPEPAVRSLVKGVLDTMPMTIGDVDDEKRYAFMEWCLRSQSNGMVSAVTSLLQTYPGVMVPFHELDRDTNMLGVGNGAVDLSTGELEKSARGDYITIITPVKYKPDAECPLFEKVVSDAFYGKQDVIDWFHRLIGYSLMGNPKDDIFVIPFGDGSNGKSTILGTVQKVLGGHAKGTPNATFMQVGQGFASAGSGPNEALLRLRASRFVYMSEPEAGSQLRTSLIKSVTGGDVITARGVHAKHSVDFRPTWVVFMPTNHKPIIKDEDNGIWRRVKLVPFLRNFDKDPDIVKDGDMEDKLVAEYEGILAWCVRGALEYQRRSLRDEPRAVTVAHAEYRADMDVLAGWLDSECVMEEGARATFGELWESWKFFATEAGTFNYISSQPTLSRRLKHRFPEYKTTKSRGIVGISLKSKETDKEKTRREFLK